MRRLVTSIAVVALGVASARPALASTIAFRTDAQLIAASERVVHARVIGQRTTAGGPGGRAIYTVTTLAVVEDFTAMPGDTIEVWELGGVLGDRILYIGGAVQYEVGQDVVVCLARGPNGLHSIAMAFSKFDVRSQAGEAMLSRDLRDLAVVGAAAIESERSLSAFRQTAAAVTGRASRVAAGPIAQPSVVAQPFTKLAGEPGWRWRQADQGVPVSYFRNTSAAPPVPGDAVPELQTALAAWTNPPTASLILQYGGTTFQENPEGGDWPSLPAKSVLITFEDPFGELNEPVLAIGGGEASIGTGGMINGVTYDGFNYGFIVVQNASQLPVSFRQPLNFTRVLTHEIGHTIGFGHTQSDGSVVNPTANIMYFSCCTTVTPTPPALGADDLLGLSTIYPAPPATGPAMTLDKASLQFGAVASGGTLVWQTSPQVVQLAQAGAGTVTWTATPTLPWLQVTPSSGTGPVNFTVRVLSSATLPAAGVVDGAISLVFNGASNSPGPIAVRLTLKPFGTSSTAFGVVDTPLANSVGMTGAVPFTGWALDDIDVERVMICRNAVAGEGAPVDPNCGGNAQIFVGAAVFIDGSRPDVQAGFPTYPRASRAGWGFMVLTNTLPAQGNGTFVFSVYAFDRDGHVSALGTRVMTCDNAHATLPFGTIDTPGQGDAVSGSGFVNFGWALTQQPKSIPFDGSTIGVYVDSVFVGTVSYNHFRSDIATLFPGYANSNGAVGFRVIDTTQLANGLHTISWTATDTAGASGGLGSRYFRVANGSAVVATTTDASSAATLTSPALNALPIDATAIAGRRGWAADRWTTYESQPGTPVVIRGEELDRFELQLPGGGRYSGHVRVGDSLASLPIGSHLDAVDGRFTWTPGVGFIGRYDLTFVRWAGSQPSARVDVRVILLPKGSGKVGPQAQIDTPRSQQDVAQPFRVAGWAADLDANAGTGVSTLHAWAFPLTGGAPIFLGLPAMGVPRSDVAALHGEELRDSGFELVVGGLPHGHYDLAVFPWSTVRGSFVPAAVVRVTVR